MRKISNNLKTVNNVPKIKEQDCKNCIYATRCYSTTASDRNTVLNVLACRIRNDIDRNRSSKMFLEMIQPNLLKLINNAKMRVGSGYIDVEDTKRDLESRVIESLISETGYSIGGIAYLTEWLFGLSPNTGWVRKFLLWGFSKNNRFFKKHRLVGHVPNSDSEDSMSNEDRAAVAREEIYSSVRPDEDTSDAVNSIKEIIYDGITLNTSEFRVMAFCLQHANPSNKVRLIDGAHLYLSALIGVSRPRVTKLFSNAKNKLILEAKRRNIKF